MWRFTAGVELRQRYYEACADQAGDNCNRGAILAVASPERKYHGDDTCPRESDDQPGRRELKKLHAHGIRAA